MKTQLPIATILLLAGTYVQAAAIDPVVLILRPNARTWAFQTATKLLLNGKNKLRVVGANQIKITPEETKRAPELPIGSSPLRVHRLGYLLARSGSGWVSAFPEGGPSSKDSASVAELWSGARVQIQAGGSKEPDIPTSTLFAILPGDNVGDAVGAFLRDESNFTGVGEKEENEAFGERMSLLVAVSKIPGGAPPQIKTILLSAMNQALQRSKGGTAKYAELQQGLKFAAVSDEAFPSDVQQQQARQQLRDRKVLIDRRVAILRALDAGRQYDAVLDKYGDFEFYDADFPDVRSLRTEAMKKSVDTHLTQAAVFRNQKQAGLAMKELRIALLRRPGDAEIEEEIEKIRIGEAQAHSRLVNKKPAADPNSPEQVLLIKHIHYAESAIKNKNFEEARDEIANAARIDKESPRLLLTKAKLYESNLEYAQAIEVLDTYDGVAPSEEAQAGRDVRDEIEAEIKHGKEKYRSEIAEDRKNGDFVQGRLHAEAIIKIAPDDPNFLFDAGAFSAVTRNEKEAGKYLRAYLAASSSMVAETKKRADVISWLPSIESSVNTASQLGVPNWFSGAATAPGLFYCPMSLLPNPKPLDIKASHKQNTTYEWNGNQLLAVDTSTLEGANSEVKIYFTYFGNGKGVKRLTTKPPLPEKTNAAPRFTGDGVLGLGEGVYPALFNNPDVNPYLVEKLMGQRVGVIVSGNSFFHPFVWDGVHVFLAEYDAEGRVKSARELHAAAPHAFDFQWEGNRLIGIVEVGAPEGYSRTMQYDGDRIMGETIRFRGRDSRIEYKYKADRLAEAVCDSDPSLDNRSRRVTFRD